MKKQFIMVRQIIIFLLISISSFVHGQEFGTLNDSRDGQTYETVCYEIDSIGTTITWMAQNLNYKTEDSWAYEDFDLRRARFGLLYGWEGAQNACPEGWRLPTQAEWQYLRNRFGRCQGDVTIYCFSDAFKSVKGWKKYKKESLISTNSSGLNILPAGKRLSKSPHWFYYLGEEAWLWSSTVNKQGVYAVKMGYKSSGYAGISSKSWLLDAHSCRCVKKI